MRGRLNRALCGVAAIGALLVAGCGAGTDTDTTAMTGGGGEAATADFTVSGGADDAKFEGPKSVPSGVTAITLTNDGDTPHSLQLIRIEGDYTEDEVFKELGKAVNGEGVGDWFAPAGGVMSTEPGASRSSSTTLEPGTYWGIDDNAGDPLKSARVSFKVTEGDGGGELPAADATITASDFKLAFDGLKAGTNSVLFKNDGQEWHHVVAAPLPDGVTTDDVQAYFQEEKPDGPPPFGGEGVSTAIIPGGAAEVSDLELEPGRYALVCFISNKEGGPPHVAMGMVTEAEIE
jgi:hypothetical protein